MIIIDTTQTDFSEGVLTNVEADVGDFLRLIDIADSHEDNDILEYTSTGGTWNVENTGARTGTYAISGASGAFDTATDTGSNTWDALYRGNYTPQLYIEQWHYFPDNSNDYNLGISFGVTGVQDFYFVAFNSNTNLFKLTKSVSGTRTDLNTDTVSGYNWLRITVLWEANGTITANLYNSSDSLLSTISATDTTFTSGGVGMAVAQGISNSAYIRFDDLKIRNVTSGNRISPQINLSTVGIIESTLINWVETLNGQTITIETRVSTDNGTNWTTWAACTNGGAIPDLAIGTDVSTGLLECRQLLSTSDITTTPQLDSLTLEINELLTTAAPTTAPPEIIISAEPINLQLGVISDGIVIGTVINNSVITIRINVLNYLHYFPAAPRDTTLDDNLLVNPIEIKISTSGDYFHKWITSNPLNIEIGVLANFYEGSSIDINPIDIKISITSNRLNIQAVKSNWVKWSKIGQLDFTIDESNIAGERPLEWPGYVHKIIKFNDSVVVYGENGITHMSPNKVHWGAKNIHRIGIAGPGAAIGTETGHYFIDLTGTLYKLSEGIEKLGYSKFFSKMTNPIMSLDIKNNFIYICDGEYGFIYNYMLNSLGEGPNNISGIMYKDNVVSVVASEAIKTPKLDICTGVYDLNIRKPKTIHSVEVGTNLVEHLMVSLDYRVSNKGNFNQIGWFLLNPDGVAYPVCYGLEFKIRLKSYIYEDIKIDYIKLNGAIHNFSYRDYLSGG